MQLSSRTISLIAVALIVCAAVAYLIFSGHSNSAPSSTAVAPTDGTAPTSDAELTFLNLASQLDTISFDATVLNDPRFVNLIDIRTAVVPEAEGRSDPFGQLSGLTKTQ